MGTLHPPYYMKAKLLLNPGELAYHFLVRVVIKKIHSYITNIRNFGFLKTEIYACVPTNLQPGMLEIISTADVSILFVSEIFSDRVFAVNFEELWGTLLLHVSRAEFMF